MKELINFVNDEPGDEGIAQWARENDLYDNGYDYMPKGDSILPLSEKDLVQKIDLKDIEEKFLSNLNFESANLYGIYSRREANKVYDIISNTLNEFPELRGMMKTIKVDTNLTEKLAGADPNSGSFVLGSAFTRGRSFLAQVIKENIKNKNYPYGLKWYSPITHEIGHYIDKYITEKQGGVYKLNSSSNFSYSIEAAITKDLKLTYPDIENGLCNMATFNSNEFLAFGYTEYVDGGKNNARKIAKYIHNAIIKQVKEYRNVKS